MRMPLIRHALPRLIFHLSMKHAMMFSNTASTVDREANAINRKKSAPQNLPPPIALNTFGKVTKMSEGP